MSKDERDIDALIDEVARGFTSAPIDDADAERFARRVSARIGAPRAGRVGAPLMALAAALCMLAVAAFVMREARRPAPVQPAPAAALARPDGRPEAVSPPAQTTAAPGRSAGSTDTRRARRVDVPTARPVIQPLTVAPIDVEREVVTPLGVSPLVVAMPIEISAIAIDRIEIPPMP